MEAQNRAYLEVKSRIFKALGHPTRLFIVEQLAQKERCVNELTEMVGSDMSTISKHLSILKNAYIIQDSKKGNHVFYSLSMPCVLNLFGCVDTVIKSVVEEQRGWVAER